MTDLGLFGRHDDDHDTGNVDVDELRKALSQGAADTPAAPPERPTTRRAALRAQREAAQRRRRRKRRHSVVAIVILVVLVAGMVGGYFWWRSDQDAAAPDFAADTAGVQTIVRVKGGDGRADIAAALQTAGVVASAQAFVEATDNDPEIQSLQPGYFRLSTGLPAAEAANQLADDTNRVGHVSFKPGDQLADVLTGADSTEVTKGYVSQLAEVACVELAGVTTSCPTVDELWAVFETGDPVELGVPEWALEGVKASPDPRRRLEGLLRPGEYDIPPNATAAELVQAVMLASSAAWSSTDLIASAKTAGLTPYEAVTIASIVQRESNPADMGKVARVIDNRRQVQMPLQMDSTVNYALGVSHLSAAADGRLIDNPWNTYWTSETPLAARGLPPTPISSPSQAALDATMAPEPGPWIYFVAIDPESGDSCFSVEFADHQACIAEAGEAGVFGG